DLPDSCELRRGVLEEVVDAKTCPHGEAALEDTNPPKSREPGGKRFPLGLVRLQQRGRADGCRLLPRVLRRESGRLALPPTQLGPVPRALLFQPVGVSQARRILLPS